MYFIWRVPFSGGGLLQLDWPVCEPEWRELLLIGGGVYSIWRVPFSGGGVYFSWRGRYANWSRIVVNHFSSGRCMCKGAG